jgi:hypothetical protein
LRHSGSFFFRGLALSHADLFEIAVEEMSATLD